MHMVYLIPVKKGVEKLLSEPVLASGQLDQWEPTSWKFESIFIKKKLQSKYTALGFDELMWHGFYSLYIYHSFHYSCLVLLCRNGMDK